MAPAPVTVLILAPAAAPDAGPLTRVLDDARTVLAGHHRDGFAAAGGTDVRIVREPPDAQPFGARLRRLLERGAAPGIVVLGAASAPLATSVDRRAFLDAAAGEVPAALANNRYSADIIAIARADLALRALADDLETDNALPRWLAEVAGVPVRDLRARRRLAMDIDSPLDLLLLEDVRGAPILPLPDEAAAGPVRERLAALRAIARDPTAELLVAGRMAAVDVRWLERETRSRSRVLIEERGLRTASLAAALGRANRRTPHSLLGLLLDRDGPGSLGTHVATLADGALVDTRVLLAHHLGADEGAWPTPEDRYASDLS
ncbi:MAG: hypothetical protein ABIR11_05255, partial [Candidatus Limnocylindrales bacterium]